MNKLETWIEQWGDGNFRIIISGYRNKNGGQALDHSYQTKAQALQAQATIVRFLVEGCTTIPEYKRLWEGSYQRSLNNKM